MENNNDELKSTLEDLPKGDNGNKKKKIKISLKTAIIIILIIITAIIVTVTCIYKIQTNKNVEYIQELDTLNEKEYKPKKEYEQIRNCILSTPDFDKPIIYLYPTEKISLMVKLGYPEKLSCSYPKYENNWNVTAETNGTLIDNKTGKQLYSLYWEGKGTANIDFSKGFCVKGEDTAEFLEDKLKVLGLNYKEREEFIIYWLPKMENNKYNLIRFASKKEIDEYMPLEFSVEPDSLIRVLMQYKKLEDPIDIKEQKLETPERTGFVAVEWGGSEIN